MKAPHKILVAVDLSEASESVLAASLTVAHAFSSSLDIVHVREPFEYPVTRAEVPLPYQREVLYSWIDTSLARLAQRAIDAGVTCMTTSLDGSAHGEIVAHAEKTGAELIILGTHGRAGLSHAVLGSVAERVVQKARRPVLVVPTGAATAE